jgi:hypothetical protein
MAFLSKADLTWILSQLQSRGVTKRSCAECGQTTWNLSDELYVLPAIQFGPSSTEIDMSTGQPVYPISCTNCGYTRFFNITPLGYTYGAGNGG